MTVEAATSTTDTTTLKGDVDGNGDINVSDSYYALQYYAEQAVGKDESELCLTADEVTRADLNGDGTITINEASYILNYYAQEAAGNNANWDSLLGDGSCCSYTDGDDSIEIGSVEVSLADLEVNDYTYTVEVPVTTTCSYGDSLAFGFTLDSSLSLDGNGCSGADLDLIEESTDMYWLAAISVSTGSGLDTITLELVLTVSEDVAVGDTFAITGYLTSPNGSPAIVNGQTATEMISGAVTVVDEYTNNYKNALDANITIDENTVSFETIQVTLSELEEADYFVKYTAAVAGIEELELGFSLDDGLHFLFDTWLYEDDEESDLVSAIGYSTSGEYFLASMSSDYLSGYFSLYFQIPTDAEVGDVYTITGIATHSDGTNCRVNWESITEVYSGSIIIVDESTQIITEEQQQINLADLDADDAITISDAFLCLTAYANSAAGNDDGLTDAQREAADVDGDGNITIMDASYILQFYAQTAAGNSPTWASILNG